MKLLAIDSNSLLNRAFYGVRPLTNKDGVFTNGIYGVFSDFSETGCRPAARRGGFCLRSESPHLSPQNV